MNCELVKIIYNYVSLLLSWQFIIGLLILIIWLYLKVDIKQKISNISRFNLKYGTSILEFYFQEKKAIPMFNESSEYLNPKIVMEIMSSCDEIKKEDLNGREIQLWKIFIDHEIYTKEQLENIVNSKEIIEKLKDIYINILRRDSKKPLDPIAIAIYGSALYIYGTSIEVVKEIEKIVKKSQEYKLKNK